MPRKRPTTVVADKQTGPFAQRVKRRRRACTSRRRPARSRGGQAVAEDTQPKVVPIVHCPIDDWYLDAENARAGTPSAASDRRMLGGLDKVYVEVTLRRMSGRQLGSTVTYPVYWGVDDTFSLRALIALGRFHELPHVRYEYYFQLEDGSTVNCTKNRGRLIREYADELPPIEIKEASWYDPASRVHALNLLQLRRELDTPEDEGAEGAARDTA